MTDNTALTVPVNEEKAHIEAQIEEAKGYYLTPKFKLWEEYFFDKKNEETFGNATLSYCRAYGLDPKDPKAYNVASVEGHRNLRKTKNLRRRYWEQLGLTPGKLLTLYNDMMVARRDVNMLYSMADDMDIELPEYTQTVAPKLASQTNTQINANDVQVTFTSLDKHDRNPTNT